MSISQAAQFEQHVNTQLSKSLGAIPVRVLRLFAAGSRDAGHLVLHGIRPSH